MRLYYPIFVFFILFFVSCEKDKPQIAQSRTLYGVIFKDTVMYIKEEEEGNIMKTLLAQNIPDGVTVTYDNNSIDREHTTDLIATATFSLMKSDDWWSFGDVKDAYGLDKPENKTEAKNLYKEDSTSNRTDPRWKNPITLKAKFKVLKMQGTTPPTDQNFFEVTIKTVKEPDDKEREDLVITGYTGMDKEIVIPTYINNKKVKGVGEKAFYNKPITSIVFPNSDSLHYIAKNAFRACTSLVNVVLSESIDSIAYGAFMGIAAESIVLGKNIRYIGEDAFGQTKLKKVTIYAVAPPKTKEYTPDGASKEGYIFTGSPIDSIFIPDGRKVGNYDAAIGWNSEEFVDKLYEMK